MHEQYYFTRTDHASAAIVNEGIALQITEGTYFAAAYMNAHNINIDIAMRVLSRPWQRRAY